MATLGRSRPRSSGNGLQTFAVLFVVSIAILLARNTDVLQTAASGATAVLVPFQSALASFGSGVDRFFQAAREIETLRTNNAGLRDDNQRLTLENVRLREQVVAAEQLASLAEVSRALPYETIVQPVIARDPSGVLRSILIGGGTSAGIAEGDVVLSDQGLVGRVTESGPNYAKVALVTDSSSVVSALVQDSRATGLVRGQFGDTLVMDWILQTEPVEVGDIVVTAGLAVDDDLRSLYPKGLVLGRVVEVAKVNDAAYLRAILRPAVDVRRLERVLVVTN